MAEQPGGEDAYFLDRYMLETQKRIAKAIKRKYDKHSARPDGPYCMFDRVERDDDLDQWQVRRQNLRLPLGGRRRWNRSRCAFALDPETFEYSIKPVPLAWFYDERFVAFLQEFIWKVPQKLGLSCSIAHGGGQFSLSAKTFLTGSLLADDIAYKAESSGTGNVDHGLAESATIARSAPPGGGSRRSSASSAATGTAASIRDERRPDRRRTPTSIAASARRSRRDGR